MPAIQSILVGTSLGPRSDDVVETGMRLASAAGAELHLVHAIEMPVRATLSLDREVRAVAARRMEEQIARLAASPVSRRIVFAPAHRALAEAADERGADLVVVGAGDRPQEPGLGSTADRLVRRAERAVLVVRPPLPLPPGRVLMPVDLSPLAGEVVRRGLALLGQLGGATAATLLEAFHSVVAWELEDEPRVAAELERWALDWIEQLFSALPDSGSWRVVRRVAFGAARERILGRIEEWRPDLVIMGTHGGDGDERVLVGSVAEGVVRRSAANVLVIPPLAAPSAALGESADPVAEVCSA